MSTAEHAFTNAFYQEFSENGATGIPNVFIKIESSETAPVPSISGTEFEDAGRVLSDHDVDIRMRILDYSKDGARALFKTAVEIPQEVLDLLKERNNLGRIVLSRPVH